MSNEKKQNILSLINKDRTNIDKLQFISISDILSFNRLENHQTDTGQFSNLFVQKNCNSQIAKTLLSYHEKGYGKILETRINEFGRLENFNIASENSYEQVNILNYISTQVPKMYKYDIEKNANVIYTIRYINFKKIEIKEEDVEKYLDNDQILISGTNGEILQINYSDKSFEKYWTENPFKAIFYLKKFGFGLNIGDCNLQESTEFIIESANEEKNIMSLDTYIDIDGYQYNGAIITKRIISEGLDKLLRTKYKKWDTKIPKIEPVSKYKSINTDLTADEIDPLIDKLKMPRRIPVRKDN